MIKLRYLICIFIFVICMDVKAVDTCSTEELARLKELANNVEIKYEYELVKYDVEDEDIEKNYDVIFKLKVLNFHDNLKLYENNNDEDNNNYINIEDFEDTNFWPGKSFTFQIYSYVDNDCTYKVLRNFSFKLPYYNDYYHLHKEKCDQYKEFEYCSELINQKIDKDDEEINEMFDKYIQSLDDNKKNNKNNNTFQSILDIFNNQFIIYGIVAVIITLIIVIIVKKNKKRKDI